VGLAPPSVSLLVRKMLKGFALPSFVLVARRAPKHLGTAVFDEIARGGFQRLAELLPGGN
jgi:hypothetical protein